MKAQKWLNDAVFYEIYPQSFYDSNADGIGDIPGIIAKLDYICSLGCNAIWMNPCFDSPFKDAGYDVRNYLKVAPRYGTNDDLYRLIEEMHRRKMHLLLDLVPCHTSEEHEWFLASSKQEKNQYSDRYIWTKGAFNKPNNLTAVGGEKERNGTYVISFFNCQPSLNYGFYEVKEPWQHKIDSEASKKTQEAMLDVMRFWLSKGVDGFRVDMAACLVKNDVDERGTQEVWKRMFKIIREEYPNAAFVSEWGTPDRALACGFDMDFYLDHGWDGGNGYHHLLRDQDLDYDTYEITSDCSYFKTDSKQTPTKFLKEYLDWYEKTKELGYICFLTDNHDMIRTSYFFDELEQKIIYGFIFTMPGVPYLYYGDEIMMRYLPIPTKEGGYHRTGSRTPMQWNKGKNLGFSDTDGPLYLPVDDGKNAKTVEEALTQKDSMYYHIQTLIALRHQYDDLKAVNNIKIVHADDHSKLFVYRRGDFWMIVNPSFEPNSFVLEEEVEPIYQIGHVHIQDGRCSVSEQCFAILKKRSR